ncbi:MAG: hypothetical protein OEL89_01940, partial [Candidatus Peregrinibacteria bacterium]|nr:hypothetical protein [Candidatus Peregrinibacteria bacterium]
MKNLYCGFRDFQKKHGRFVFMENRVESDTPEENTVRRGATEDAGARREGRMGPREGNGMGSLEEMFLNFSVKNIKDLDRAGEHEQLKEPGAKKKFQTLVEHRLKMAENSDEASRYFPPRVLYAIKNSKYLSRYLKQDQLDRIDKAFDSKRQMVKGFLQESPSEWTVQQIIHMSAFFENLRKKKQGFTKNDSVLYYSLSKNLVGKGVELLSRCLLKEERRGDSIFDENSEKLLILELDRIFSDAEREDWRREINRQVEFDTRLNLGAKLNTREFSDVLRGLSTEVASYLNDETNNVNAVLFWETIQDLELPDLNDDKILEGVQRNNAAQFLIWQKGKPELLPSQYKFLDKLSKGGRPYNFDKAEFVTHLGEAGEQDSYRNIKAKEEILEERQKVLKDNLLNLQTGTCYAYREEGVWENLDENIRGSMSIQRDDYLAEKHEMDGLVASVKTFLEGMPEYVKNKLLDFNPEMEEMLSRLNSLSDNENYINDFYKLADELETEFDNYVRELQGRMSSTEDVEETERLQDEFNAYYSFHNGGVGDGDGYLDWFRKLKGGVKKYRKAVSNFSEKLKTITGAVEEGSINNKIEKLKEELEVNKKKLEKATADDKDEERVLEYLDDPNKYAKEQIKSFKSILHSRVKANSILSNDLLIFFENEELAKSIYTDVLGKTWAWDRVKEFRDEKIAPIFEDILGETTEAGILDKIDRGEIEKQILTSGYEEIFGQEQNPLEIIDGFVEYYRDKIFNQIRDSEIEVSEGFYDEANRRFRIHSTVRNVHEIAKLQADAEGYRQDKFFEKKLIAEETVKFQKVLDQISDGTEKDNLQRVFDERKKRLVEGYLDGNDLVLGMNQLRTLKIRTIDLVSQINEAQNKVGEDISRLREEFIALEDIEDEDERNAARENLRSKFNGIFDLWENSVRGEISDKLESYRNIFENVLGEPLPRNFQDYFRCVTGEFEDIDKIFAKAKRDTRGNKFNELTGFEDFFNGFPKRLHEFSQALNFESGFWKQKHMEVHESFNATSHTTEILRNWERFEDGGKGKAKKNYEKEKSKFSEKYSKYNASVKNVIRKINRDVGRLYDEEFVQKYSFPKDQAQKIISDMKTQNLEFDTLWDKFHKGNTFWDEFEKKWAGSEGDKSDALNMLNNWERISNQVDIMAEQTKGLEEWIKDYDKQPGMQGKWARHLNPGNYEAKWFSLLSIYQTITQFFEARDKKLKRSTDKMVGQLGVGLFGRKSNTGKEFWRLLNNSESERVNEFKEGYADDTDAQIRESLSSSKDQDEVRAILDLLNERGVLHWDDPVLLGALNRIQSTYYFDVDKDSKPDSIEQLKSKIRDACAGVWSQEVFRQWDNSKDDNLSKKMEGWHSEFTASQDRRGLLRGMLRDWKMGVNLGNIDPTRYEAYISFAIKDGKMTIEDKFYYLIMGVTTKNSSGKSLLSMEAFSRFSDGGYFSLMPQMDFFAPDERSWKKDGKVYTDEKKATEAGAVARGWNYSDFECWTREIKTANFEPGDAVRKFIHRTVERSANVKDRFIKTASKQKEMDHDDAPSRFAAMTLDAVQSWSATESHTEIKSTMVAWRGFLLGANQWFYQAYREISELEAQKPDGWEDERKELLLEVGEKMRVALAIAQVLKRNWVPRGQITHTTFINTKTEWEKTYE